MAKYSKEDIPNLDLDTLFKVGMSLANKIIGNKLGGMTWDDLPDINSLWDHISEGMTGDDFIQGVKDAVDDRLSEMEDDMDLFEVEREVPENPEDYIKQPGYISENKKIVQITKDQLQKIISEGVKKLHKKTLIENRIKQINEELNLINEVFYGDSDGDYEFDISTQIQAEELYDRGLELFNQGDIYGAEELRQQALKKGSWISWGELEFPPFENGINEEFGNLNKSKDTYFETLSSTLDAAREKANSMGYELDEEEVDFQFGSGGISYDTTKSAVIDLLKDGEPILGKSGKSLNRAMSISIYRMPSGRYELTAYKTW